MLGPTAKFKSARPIRRRAKILTALCAGAELIVGAALLTLAAALIGS